jgi:signal recognition particle receptor subunit beta/outer membrane biosynthesis protein TonB
MVFFNYATMQMAAKIVYYGPGLCGKTTNLHQIYTKTSPQSRGEMVSLETETDRTLFFDLLPIDVGVIGGFKTRLQLYTVPGQVFYNTTRKLVLKGVDGIVFVVDSQAAMLDANLESLKNLAENLAEIGVTLDEIPTVLQLNKRDLASAAPVETILNHLDPERKLDHVEAIASAGTGVFETLKLISKLTLRTLRRRMTGEEPLKAAPASRLAQFRVQRNDVSPVRTIAQSTPLPAVSATAIAEPQSAAAQPQAESFDAEATVAAVAFDRNILADVPVAEPPDVAPSTETAEPEPAPILDPPTDAPPLEEPEPEPEDAPEPQRDPEPEPPAPAPEPEAEPEPEAVDEVPDFEAPSPQQAPRAAFTSDPEIDFRQTDKPQNVEEVKTVKVRNSVDVMAELEALRKRATNTGPKAPRRDILADLANLRPRRDLNRHLSLSLPADVLGRAKTVRVTLSFEDAESGVVETRDHTVELGDTSDAQSLSVNLKIDLA